MQLSNGGQPYDKSGLVQSISHPDESYYNENGVWLDLYDYDNTANFCIKGLALTTSINQPPTTPIITGPASGKTEISYDYYFNAIDPDDDQVKYIIDWGDGKTDTTDLNPSDVDATVAHTWNEKGEYTIKVHAQDQFGSDGPESTKKVTMPRNRVVTWNYLLTKVLNRFPIIKEIFLQMY